MRHLSLLVLSACPMEQELPSELGECLPPTVTWEQVQPVLDAHCNSCHSASLAEGERQGAPLLVNFDSPEDARTNGFLTWTVIQTDRMPPLGPLEHADALLIWDWLSCNGPG